MSEDGQQKTSIQLGELLLEAGLINRAQLDEGLWLAEQTALPLGRVLIMTTPLREPDLHAAVQAQSLLKDGLLAHDTAYTALKNAVQGNLSLEQALSEFGWYRTDAIQMNRLGELLLEAELISSGSLTNALEGSFSTGLPLGRFLALSGILPEALLAVALNAQTLIREGKVTRERAVQGMKDARERLKSQTPPSSSKLPARYAIKLGEIFVMAGVVSESDLMNALELGLVGQQSIGQVLLQMGLIDQTLLDAAVKLQELVSSGQLRPLQASAALAHMHNSGIGLSEAIAKLDPTRTTDESSLSLRKFLKLVGSITDNDIQSAVEIGIENSQIFGRMLMLAGIVDETTLQAASRCSALVRADLLSLEQACYAFNYSQQRLISMDEALQELGWTHKIASNMRNADAVDNVITLDD